MSVSIVAVFVIDAALDVREAMAVGRDHLGHAVADDELRTREREPRLLVRDRKSGVADKIAEDVGRQLHRRRFECRDLGELFAVDAGETEVRAAALHRDPLVLLFFEMHIARIESSRRCRIVCGPGCTSTRAC